MKKLKITIEETIDQDFEIEANSEGEAYELAIKKYKEGEFVLDNPTCTSRMISINDEDFTSFD